MKKLFLLLAVSICSYLLQAQSSGNYQYGNSGNNQYQLNQQSSSREPATLPSIRSNDEIEFTVNVLMNMVADEYVAVFNIVQVGATTDTVNKLMNERISQLKRSLHKAGIDTTAMQTDMISFVPKYTYETEVRRYSRTYNEVPAGFEMQKNVIVPFHHSADIDRIISAASAAEVYDLVKVDYFLKDNSKALDTLRGTCLDLLKKKTNDYERLGIDLDKMKKTVAEDYSTTYPPNRYYSYQAFSHPSIETTRKTIINHTYTAVVSKYYSPLPYDNYDMVIHPVVTEPAVQLSYSITIRYIAEEPGKTYYIITSSGTLQPITVN